MKEIDYEKTAAFIRLNQLKVGDVVTKDIERDLRLITGPSIEMRSLNITFDKSGQAHTVDDDVFESVMVDGTDILNRPNGDSQ